MKNFDVLSEWVTTHYKSTNKMSRASHFECNDINMYVKVQYEILAGVATKVISIDSLYTNQGKMSNGLFTSFIIELEKLAASLGAVVYVNSVINERLSRFFQRRNYLIQYPEYEVFCYYKQF